VNKRKKNWRGKIIDPPYKRGHNKKYVKHEHTESATMKAIKIRNNSGKGGFGKGKK